MKLSFLSLAAFCSVIAINCTKDPYIKKLKAARELYTQNNYKDALPIYESLKDSGKLDLDIAVRLAVCIDNVHEDSAAAKKIVDDYIADNPVFKMFTCLGNNAGINDSGFNWKLSLEDTSQNIDDEGGYLTREQAIARSKAYKHPDRSAKAIDSLIKSELPNLRLIYKLFLKADPTLEGTVKIGFDIQPDGSLAYISITESEIPDLEFNKKIQKAMLNWRFKPIPPEMGPLNVTYPLKFRKQDF
ncbi:MAG: TonB family protein [bacterium]